MGDTIGKWEIEFSSSSSSDDSSRATWIRHKGLNVVKKIVITGVVISSTPLLLPPLLVASAIGFALSIPSGILLSTYVCTQKLMSMLLPIRPDYPLMLEGYGEEGKELGDGYCGKGFEDEGGSAIEDEYEEDVGGYLDIGGTEEETLPRKPGQPSDHESVPESANLEKENVDERELDDKFPTVETRKDEIKEEENEKMVDDAARETVQGADIRGRPTENRDENKIGETNKKSAKKRKGNKKQNTGTAHEELPKKSEEEKVVQPTNVAARGIVQKTAEDTSELRGSEEVPESKQTAATPTGKVELSEEKIWERLDALRAIVGYEASPHRTYVGELRALYMFTGVEPPTYFQDPSDLVEVNEKLGFLMSIVGVK